MKNELQAEELEEAILLVSRVIVDVVIALQTVAAVAQAISREIKVVNLRNDNYDLSNEFMTITELSELIEKMCDLAEGSTYILQPKKLPRPPKRIGPVNKPNYIANRPQIRARSNCRAFKHQ